MRFIIIMDQGNVSKEKGVEVRDRDHENANLMSCFGRHFYQQISQRRRQLHDAREGP